MINRDVTSFPLTVIGLFIVLAGIYMVLRSRRPNGLSQRRTIGVILGTTLLSVLVGFDAFLAPSHFAWLCANQMGRYGAPFPQGTGVLFEDLDVRSGCRGLCRAALFGHRVSYVEGEAWSSERVNLLPHLDRHRKLPTGKYRFSLFEAETGVCATGEPVDIPPSSAGSKNFDRSFCLLTWRAEQFEAKYVYKSIFATNEYLPFPYRNIGRIQSAVVDRSTGSTYSYAVQYDLLGGWLEDTISRALIGLPFIGGTCGDAISHLDLLVEDSAAIFRPFR